MPCEVPFNLDRSWFLSDVVLLAENAEGRELHLLSAASPVFRAMFFSSSFEESNQDRIKISIDYEALKEVLRVLLHFSCDCLTKKINKESLFPMYMVADMWDFPTVRKVVLEMAKIFNNGLYEEILESFRIDENVTCIIPKSFEVSWFLSDAEVVSREGERFHVSKALFSFGSSFFRERFLAQKEIVYQMHHYCCDCSEVTDANTLLQVHLAANWLNIPRIKEGSLPQLDEFPKILQEETERFIRGETRSLISLFQNLDSKELAVFLSIEDRRPIFSKKDIATLCGISSKMMAEKPSRVVNLTMDDIAEAFMIPVNFTKPNSLYDVQIITKGGDLYAKKKILARHSRFFAKKFQEDNWSEGKAPNGYDFIRIDEEYPTMHIILSVIHDSVTGIDFLSASFLHDIYQTASEERLDIPLVRELCRMDVIDYSWRRNDRHLYLELAIIFKFYKGIDILLKRMDQKGELAEWLEGSSERCSYFKDEQEIVIEAKPDEPVFSLQNVKIIRLSDGKKGPNY